jgi:hypothetical protein
LAKAENGTKKRGRPTGPAVTGENGPSSDAVVGFEAKLWQMADKLRNNMDAGEYKHVVLGLIFLKYISDAFEERHAALEADRKSGADPEGRTSTAPTTSSGCPRRRAGRSCRAAPRSRRSAS